MALLNFNDMWMPVMDAMKNGQFDPQGANFSQSLLSLPSAQPQATTAMAQGPMPPPPQMTPQPQPFQSQTPQGSAMSGGGLPIPSLGGMNMPSGGFPNPFAGGPGIGDRLMAGGAGFFNAGGPMQAIGNLLGGLATGQRQDAAGVNAQNQFAMFKALQEAGFNPAMARLGAMDPKIAESMVTQPELVKTYQYAKAQGFKGSLEDWNSALKGENTLQIDGGDKTIIVDKKNPSKTLAIIPKDLAAAASARTQGETQGAAAAALPNTMLDINNALETAQALKSHPGKGKAIGLGYGSVPTLAGTQEADFEARLSQLGSQAFLSQIPKMTGMGALSNAEGARLASAATRLSRRLSPSDFDQALSEYTSLLQKAAGVAQQKAGKSLENGIDIGGGVTLRQIR